MCLPVPGNNAQLQFVHLVAVGRRAKDDPRYFREAWRPHRAWVDTGQPPEAGTYFRSCLSSPWQWVITERDTSDCVLSKTGAPSSNELLAYFRVAGPCPRSSLRSASPPPPGPRDVVILICRNEFTKSKLSLDPLDIHCLAPAGALVRPVRLQAPLASWRMEHPPSRRPWRIRLVGPSLAPLRAKPPPATGPNPVVHG